MGGKCHESFLVESLVIYREGEKMIDEYALDDISTWADRRTKCKISEIEEEKPHKVSEVICVKCGFRWIAVRPEGTLLKTLECSKCSNIGFVIEIGETIEA